MRDEGKRPEVPARLGVGPVSRNVVHAAIRAAYRHRRSVMLVASRGQIECEELGGGYVENWSTEIFTRYVRERDPAGLVKICRDHGGPWQHPDEVDSDMPEPDALDRSRLSLHCDIVSGMDLLHLDTSRDALGDSDFDRGLRRLVNLYAESQEYALSEGQRVAFEVGVERQGTEPDDPCEFRYKVEQIVGALDAVSLPMPTFIVAQTGTRVAAMENRGALVRRPRAVARVVGELARECWRYGSGLKVHNADYLPKPALMELLGHGADAINVAPEFGVVETKALLGLLADLDMSAEREEFLRLAYESEAWCKWFDDDASDLERSIVAGHYVFATDDFLAIKAKADDLCRRRRTSVDQILGMALDPALERYASLTWEMWPEGDR